MELIRMALSVCLFSLLEFHLGSDLLIDLQSSNRFRGLLPDATPITHSERAALYDSSPHRIPCRCDLDFDHGEKSGAILLYLMLVRGSDGPNWESLDRLHTKREQHK